MNKPEKQKISKSLKESLWTLITWMDFFEKDEISIIGTDCCFGELCLQNKKIGFMMNFEIDDEETIDGLCSLLCLWANKGTNTKEDYDGNDIFELVANEEWSKINSG